MPMMSELSATLSVPPFLAAPLAAVVAAAWAGLDVAGAAVAATFEGVAGPHADSSPSPPTPISTRSTLRRLRPVVCALASGTAVWSVTLALPRCDAHQHIRGATARRPHQTMKGALGLLCEIRCPASVPLLDLIHIRTRFEAFRSVRAQRLEQSIAAL